ncbi:MAG: hypothetical protein IPN17_02780 [Deltaproteobacteria bacterium]|nr:hypothetical protein [Deltaproteobacteria bacterium]
MARTKPDAPKKPDAPETPAPDLQRRPAETEPEVAAAAKAALEAARGAFRDASRGMYELGQALALLQRPGMSEAAGHAGFEALCAAEFELHPQTVDRLLRAVGHVSGELFTALGPSRVNALLDLATVTEADDTAAILTGEVVRLWKGGPKVDLAKVPTEKIIEHTKAVRARALALGEWTPEPRTATAEEREAAEAATKRLHHMGIAATVTVRATEPGSPSEFDIVGLDRSELERVTKA